MISQEDHIYFDAQTSNLKNTTAESEQITFRDIRNSTIIDKPDEYKLSVVRFQCDTTLLPVFIPKIELNQASPDLTIYAVTIEYDGAWVRVPITWEPEIITSTPPAPNTLPYGQQQNSIYYYSLNYQHFIRLINNALKTSLDLLKIAKPAIGVEPDIFLGWNTDTLTAELVTGTNFDIGAGLFKVFFNRPLYALFGSFAAIRQPINTTGERIYQLDIRSNTLYNVDPDYRGTSVAKIILKQNYSTIANWSPVSSIVFTSPNLPVVASIISSPIVNLEGQIYPTSSSNNATVNLITDVSTNDLSYKSNIIYNPSAEYRWIGLYGSNAIQNIEVSVLWRDTQGNYHPLTVPSGGSASIKILFQRKTTIEMQN